MSKILDIVGLGFLAIMTLGFVGVLEPYGIKNGISELFLGCAGGTLMIIIYRKMKRKEKEAEEEN